MWNDIHEIIKIMWNSTYSFIYGINNVKRYSWNGANIVQLL